MEIKSFKDLIVWQKAKDLSILIYKTTSTFPKEEQFGITSQIRRSAISISSNIAEGRGRSTRKDFINFLHISLGSCYELESQLITSKDLGFISKENYEKIEILLSETRRMLLSMIGKLKA